MSEQKIRFSFLTKGQDVDTKEPVYTFIATKEVVDREDDLIRVDGIDYRKFKENPVILFGHNYRDFPVGKAVNIRKGEDKGVPCLYVDIVFADTEEGKKIEYLVENGFIKTVSIGFRVLEIFDKRGIWKSYDELKSAYPDWYNQRKSAIEKAERVFTKIELFEVSIVPVPANQDALLVMASKGIKEAYAFSDDNHLIEIPIPEVKNAVRYSEHPANMRKDETSSWDRGKAVQSLRKWASTDGSGEKEKIIWSKYRKGFGWYDANAIDNFTSYKYPHHWVVDGDFYVVWRGVVSAMVFLDRGDIPGEDRRSLYNHLARHYREDFNREPPPYRDRPRSIKEALEDYDDEHLEIYLKEVLEVKDFKEFLNSLDKEISDLRKEIEGLKTKLAEKMQEKETQEDTQEKQEKNQDNSNTKSSDTDDNSTPPPSESDGAEKNQGVEKIRVSDEFLNQLPQILDKLLQEKLLREGK